MPPQGVSIDNANSHEFKYDSLKGKEAIRLLTIVSFENDTMHCTVETVALASKPAYNALSYTWGDPRPKGRRTTGLKKAKRQIYINGSMMMVSFNLYDALIQLASGTLELEGPIWIDAICINQGDKNEKSSQVAMMDQIYSNASMVVAWLGNADGFTMPGMEAIWQLAAANAGRKIHEDLAAAQQQTIESHGLSNEQEEGLIAVFCRAWFTRVWIIQEVALAQNFTALLGAHIISRDILSGAAVYLVRAGLWFKLVRHVFRFSRDTNTRNSRDAPVYRSTVGRLAGLGVSMLCYTLDSLRDLIALYNRDVPALGAVIGSLAGLENGIKDGRIHPKLVTLFGRGNDASDKRDHIYGMLGLVKVAQRVYEEREHCPDPPTPEYGDSVEKVMHDWAKWMIEGMDNHLLLSSVEDQSHRRLRSLPSWIPDLTTSMRPTTLLLLEQHREWHPSGQSSVGELIPVQESTLVRTKAALFDTVITLATSFDAMVDKPSEYREIVNLIECLLDVAEPYQDPYSALARTITAGAARDFDAPTLTVTLAEWVHAKAISHTLQPSNDHPDPTAAERVQWFEAASSPIRPSRRLFLTSKGYLGIAAQSTKIGDVVWLLPGARTPFVMRAHSSGSYTLIGEAYVHGIMKGEVAELVERQDLLIR